MIGFICSLLIALLAAAARASEPAGFEMYQVIIDRSPFGGMPGGASSTGPQPSFSERYAFVGLVRDGEKLMAVIQDKSGNRSEYKAAGEMLGDIKVVRIEPAAAASKLVLQRGIETATLTYPTRSGSGGPVVMPTAGAAPAAMPSPAMIQPPPPQPGGDGAMPLRRRIPFRRGGE